MMDEWYENWKHTDREGLLQVMFRDEERITELEAENAVRFEALQEQKTKITELEGFIDAYCGQPDQTKVFDKFKATRRAVRRENVTLKARITELEAACSNCYDAQQRGEDQIKTLQAKLDAVNDCDKRLNDYLSDADGMLETLQAKLGAVKALKRFNNVNDSYVMVADKSGLWVRYSDVLKTIGEQE